jgi:hypothetical protein
VNVKATLVDSVMAAWAPDTRHYVTEDGRHLAVHVATDLNARTITFIDEALAANEIPALSSGSHKVVVEPTTVFECTEEGNAITLDPVHSFPPGTSHEAALHELGYTTNPGEDT